ncbi:MULTISPECIES: FMN-dependent NADH-azoreductase [Vibrio]|uniref:FMN dependent NADH:quinone oxidoreductase n=2 Tax=Vibrio TaxID=662 RepID=A0A7X4RW90_9VIBR|nr:MULTISPECIES: FMN-dependent NADH-azoreductase [Vibrio]MBF9000432.1 FMN-dependent NADH-azoreductase [Vibrio nitrifigilis]MZI95423.1 FMN-dependent NADH-azoreductase [Vibrio eleionomae]
MSRVLALKSSILGEYSQSSKLLDEYLAQFDKEQTTLRDLAANPLPVLDFSVVNALGSAGNADQTAEQKEVVALSDTLIEELKAADTLVIAAPMYNFTVPTQLKNWFDLIARAGVTFQYSENGPEGLIKGKKAVVITTRGGIHKDAPQDIATAYLKTILGFIGITDVEFAYAEALNMGDENLAKGLETAKAELSAISL